MAKLVREVTEIAEELREKWTISHFEALQIAVKIQQNRMFSYAYLLEGGGKNALEAIGMELGAGGGSSIQTAISSIADAIDGIADKIAPRP